MLTYKEIEAASKQSRKIAKACSRQHWEEMKAAKQKDFYNGQNTLTVGKLSCALCMKYNDHYHFDPNTGCRECNLWNGTNCEDDVIYRKAKRILANYMDDSSKYRRKWQRAASKIINQIEQLK